MNSKQKLYQSKLQLLATKNGLENSVVNHKNSGQKTIENPIEIYSQNHLQNSDLKDKITDFNSQNSLEKSNIRFSFGQNNVHNSGQNFATNSISHVLDQNLPNSSLDLQNLQKKLTELKNDKTKLQLEIQNLQTKIQTQGQIEKQKQNIFEQTIAKQNWQNWQLDKQNQQLFNQFTQSQNDKLEILKQRVFWQKKAKEKIKIGRASCRERVCSTV